jgi:hypothetical protein
MPKRTRATKETDRKGEKAWLKKSKLSAYGQHPREVNKTFLIVCEGQTEKLYFDAFPVVSARGEVGGYGQFQDGFGQESGGSAQEG